MPEATKTPETTSEGSSKYGPMTIREWIGGGAIVVFSIAMWYQLSDLNEFMRTTFTEKLIENKVAQTETKSAILTQTTSQAASALAETKAIDDLADKTDDLGDFAKDLAKEIGKLSDTNERLVDKLMERKSDDAAPSEGP